MMQKAVFLDRDGVLNEAIIRGGRPYPPSSLDEFQIKNDAMEALNLLKKNNFILIVVTNQPDISRGTMSSHLVKRINSNLMKLLPLDAIQVCEHDNHDNCDCRKPKPGMLLRAGNQFGIDFSKSFMVGDRWRDIEAGKASGCKTVLIGDGYNERFPSPPDYKTDSLMGATKFILHQSC